VPLTSRPVCPIGHPAANRSEPPQIAPEPGGSG
jgi:hypothetical protein